MALAEQIRCSHKLADGDVKTEMERLTGNLLNFSAVIPAIYSPDSNTITVVLLNVRSISSKLPDIVQDATLISADVACITETWLRQSQTWDSCWSSLEIFL